MKKNIIGLAVIVMLFVFSAYAHDVVEAREDAEVRQKNERLVAEFEVLKRSYEKKVYQALVAVLNESSEEAVDGTLSEESLKEIVNSIHRRHRASSHVDADIINQWVGEWKEEGKIESDSEESEEVESE